MNKIIIYLFVFSLLFNVWQYGYWNNRQKHDEKRISQSELKYKQAKDSISALNTELAEANYFSLETNQNAIDHLEEFDLNILLPYVKEQINNLNSQPKGNPLVPLDPINGNKFVINKIKFLNSRWIIGDFSNGELWGEVLIKYFMNDDKTVSFETGESLIYAK